MTSRCHFTPCREFGSFCLILALGLTAYNFLIGWLALWPAGMRRVGRALGIPEANLSRLGETARRAGIASFVVLCCAAFALVWAAFTNDFSVEYIRAHSNIALNPAYKFAALWCGQEGSLLLWAFLLSAYGFVLRVRHRVDVRLTAFASVIWRPSRSSFCCCCALPRRRSPSLRARWLPTAPASTRCCSIPRWSSIRRMLYLGYVGFAVPFAFALGALMMRYPGEKWIHITRRWTMVTWLFLTCGIFMGAHWAYSVLGWGGYWGWDPVENASLMPWLTGTAFLHSVMMQEKRGMMKNWNVWLIFSTFMLTHPGHTAHPLRHHQLRPCLRPVGHRRVVLHLHPDRLRRLPVHLLLPARPPQVREQARIPGQPRVQLPVQQHDPARRLLHRALGHALPRAQRVRPGSKVTVGAPFYNRVNIPIGLFLLFLTGIGPLLAWRSTTLRSIRRNFILPCASPSPRQPSA